MKRRDFLKLAGLLPLSLVAPRVTARMPRLTTASRDRQNVIVVVFDAFSALNMGLYGYSRPTTPNLARLAKRAIVYHNHYAASSFTTSGTASLLTGTLPWTHRAIQKNGRVAEDFVQRNLFKVFDDYHRIAYTHNAWAYTLLKQFQDDLEDLVPIEELYLRFHDGFIHGLFGRDDDIASVGWTRNVNVQEAGYAYSLLLSRLYPLLEANQDTELARQFPRGIPSTEDVGTKFLLGTAIDWIGSTTAGTTQPFLGYFHLLPPHFPYRTSIDFYDAFKGDGYRAIPKPEDLFASDRVVGPLLLHRREYDEFLLDVDREFQRLYDALDRSGLLENSWLIMTSDHGEMFERGIMGHVSLSMYEPVLRVPLLIFEPGRQVGMEVHSVTSAVDLLPTLAELTGHSIPEWNEGMILPPYGSDRLKDERSVFAVQAFRNEPLKPITHGSAALIHDPYKLMYYVGYPELDGTELVKLYDTRADPEELDDLAEERRDIRDELLRELKSRLEQADRSFVS